VLNAVQFHARLIKSPGKRKKEKSNQKRRNVGCPCDRKKKASFSLRSDHIFFFLKATNSGLIFNKSRIHPEIVHLSLFYRKHPKEKRKHAHVPGSFISTISAAVLDLSAVAPIHEDEEEQVSR
jgi:hypothetical protein